MVVARGSRDSKAAKSTEKTKHVQHVQTRETRSNAIDKAEDADKGPQRQRCLKRRSTEEDAEKAVRDNFKMYSEAQRRMVLDKDGKSVYDRVLEAKRRKNSEPDWPLGKTFYDSLKDELFKDFDPMMEFPEPPPGECIDEELFKALKRVLQRSRDFTACATYLASGPKLNATNFQALLRACLNIMPGGKHKTRARPSCSKSCPL